MSLCIVCGRAGRAGVRGRCDLLRLHRPVVHVVGRTRRPAGVGVCICVNLRSRAAGQVHRQRRRPERVGRLRLNLRIGRRRRPGARGVRAAARVSRSPTPSQQKSSRAAVRGRAPGFTLRRSACSSSRSNFSHVVVGCAVRVVIGTPERLGLRLVAMQRPNQRKHGAFFFVRFVLLPLCARRRVPANARRRTRFNRGISRFDADLSLATAPRHQPFCLTASARKKYTEGSYRFGGWSGENEYYTYVPTGKNHPFSILEDFPARVGPVCFRGVPLYAH
jgi:hypothetical protein